MGLIFYTLVICTVSYILITRTPISIHHATQRPLLPTTEHTKPTKDDSYLFSQDNPAQVNPAVVKRLVFTSNDTSVTSTPVVVARPSVRPYYKSMKDFQVSLSKKYMFW